MKNSKKIMRETEKEVVKGLNSVEEAAYTLFADMMIEKIESLSSSDKWQQPWFSGAGSIVWPTNLSGRAYSAHNAMMLMLLCEEKGYKMPVFATFNKITSYNVDAPAGAPRVLVKKGEKSFPVSLFVFNVKHKETGEIISYEEYIHLEKEKQQTYTVTSTARIYKVFNVEQTTLEEARPDIWQKLVDRNNGAVHKVQSREEMFSLPAVDKLIEHQAWICPIDETDGNQCYYSITNNKIKMVRRENFKSGELFVSNLFHEMAHSTMTMIKRFDATSMSDKEKAAEELKAELTAAMVCCKYGIVKNLKTDSAVYLKSWLDSLKESPKFIKTIMGDVRKMSAAIINKLDKVELVDCPSVDEEDNANKAA